MRRWWLQGQKLPLHAPIIQGSVILIKECLNILCATREGKKVAFVLTSINFISQNEMGKSHIPSIIIANIRSLPAALAKQQLTMMPFRAILQLFFHCYWWEKIVAPKNFNSDSLLLSRCWLWSCAFNNQQTGVVRCCGKSHCEVIM